jgi:alkaline phosphatase D
MGDSKRLKRRSLLKAGALLPLAGCGEGEQAPVAQTVVMPSLSPLVTGNSQTPIDMPRVVFPEMGQEPASFDFPLAARLPFAHGVASGDPLSNRVIIWTRVTLPPGSTLQTVPVNWYVATDKDMRNVVRSGMQATLAERDWTVKVDVTGLSPASTYYYQFETFKALSAVGRTRTAPVADVTEIRMAVVSCSSYWSSTWSGYDHIAKRNDLDLVLHCGDYIYDFVDEDEQLRARKNKKDTNYVDYRDWTNLEELRRRYALYRSDPQLLRAHQQHPWFIVWDNHDIDPDYGNELPSPALKSSTTVQQTTQAFWEWTPSRPVKADSSGEFIFYDNGEYPSPANSLLLYRKLPYGPLLTLFGVDTQIALDAYEQTVDSSHLTAEKSLFGRRQFEWLVAGLAAEQDKGTVWKVINNQTWFAPWAVPNVTGAPLMDLPVRWSGFKEERSKLIDALRSKNMTGTVFVTGDMHGNWAADVIKETEAAVVGTYQSGPPVLSARAGAQAMNPTAGWGRAASGNIASQNNRALSCAIDFAPSSMGRGGADELVANAAPGSPESAHIAGSRAVEAATLAGNRHVQFMEWVEHGYGIVQLDKEKALFEFWWQDKRLPSAQSVDVLGYKMVSWSKSGGTANGVPKFANQIDDVTIFGLPVEKSVGSRTALQAPAVAVMER